jgi:CubicO group peptidase (beta-lactamase class C family)
LGGTDNQTIREDLSTSSQARYASDSYDSFAPGTAYDYSDVNAAVAGYLVEVATGTSFDEYTKTRILDPLGMRPASWDPRPVVGADNAIPYVNYEPVTPDEYVIVYPGSSMQRARASCRFSS